MELLLNGREWSDLGSRDIDGKAERPSERARTSQWISELGIYDYRHRMYDPDLGRFLQSDPTGFDAGDMNLFRYCGDDPVDRSDPTGLVDRDVNASIWNRLRMFDSASTDSGSLYELDHPQQPTGVIVHWDITNTIRLVRNVTKRDEGKSKGVSRRISAG